MQDSRNAVPDGRLRRLVLGAALAGGLAVALLPHPASVSAADLPAPGATAQTSKAPAAKAPPAPKAPATGAAEDPATADAAADAPEGDSADSGSTTSRDREIIIDKGGKHIRIQGFGRDREYDSFEQFVHDTPWLAALVFVTTLTIFLVPLLIIVLLIWYKLRKNRLANETMLKLAERGVVPPAAAMDAVASGNTSSLAAAGAALSAAAPPNTPAYEHAYTLRRRIVWSDLRKGVILTAVGLGLTFFSMLDDGTPNSVGLVLLFVGLGYCILWFFEDRKMPPSDTPGTPPPAGGA